MTPAALHILLRTLIALLCLSIAHAQGGPSMILSLDGEWLLAVDPQNVGRDEGWPKGAVPQAVPARVPWIIQDAFPGYHGVAWYSTEFDVPAFPPGRRMWLLFGAVDGTCEVWVDGKPAGKQDEDPGLMWDKPFALEVAALVAHPGKHRVTVRVRKDNYAAGIWKPVELRLEAGE